MVGRVCAMLWLCRHRSSMGQICVLILCFLLEVANISDSKAVDCWTMLKLKLLGFTSFSFP